MNTNPSYPTVSTMHEALYILVWVRITSKNSQRVLKCSTNLHKNICFNSLQYPDVRSYYKEKNQ